MTRTWKEGQVKRSSLQALKEKGKDENEHLLI
jgi:hypothetical protein